MSRYLFKLWKIENGRWTLIAEEAWPTDISAVEIAVEVAGLVREAVETNSNDNVEEVSDER